MGSLKSEMVWCVGGGKKYLPVMWPLERTWEGPCSLDCSEAALRASACCLAKVSWVSGSSLVEISSSASGLPLTRPMGLSFPFCMTASRTMAWWYLEPPTMVRTCSPSSILSPFLCFPLLEL